MSNHFENGRAKALAEIEAKFASKLSGNESTPQQVANSRSRFSSSAPKPAPLNIRQALQNSLNASRTKGRQMVRNGIARATDGMNIVTQDCIRTALENSKPHREAVQKLTVQNRAVSLRRLGFPDKKAQLQEKIAALLDSVE